MLPSSHGDDQLLLHFPATFARLLIFFAFAGFGKGDCNSLVTVLHFRSRLGTGVQRTVFELMHLVMHALFLCFFRGVFSELGHEF